MFDIDSILSKTNDNNEIADNENDFNLDTSKNISQDLQRWENIFLNHLKNKEHSDKTIRSYIFTIDNFILFSKKYAKKDVKLLSKIDAKYVNAYLEYLEYFTLNHLYGIERERLLILGDYLNSYNDSLDDLENRHNFIENKLEYEPDRIDYILDLWDTFLETKNVAKIEEKLIIEFVNYMKKDNLKHKSSIKTMRLRKSTLQSFLSFISNYNINKVNFQEYYPLLKNYKLEKNYNTHQIRGLSQTDENKLSSFLSQTIILNNKSNTIKNILLIQLMLYAGLRVSEAVHLKFQDIEEKKINNEIIYTMNFVGKGNKRRVVPIKLKHIKDTMPYILNNKKGLYLSSKSDGKKMSEEGIKVFFKKIQKEAKLENKYSVHQLRHSFAENFVVLNGNIRILQEILGHSDIKTSMIYGQVKESDVLKNAI